MRFLRVRRRDREFSGEAVARMSMPQLRQWGNQWSFHNESELEEFVWTHLQSLLGFLPLKRQYAIKGQFCDILAVTQNQQLVVIELKNETDRYVVQQLTRYYHALQQERSFSEQVDYSKPIRLIAIAPSFHRDNLIDQQYSHLAIEFFKFEIGPDEDEFVLKLQDLETGQTWRSRLANPTQNSSWDIPPVPRKLLNNLATEDETRRTQILDVRRRLLEFDERMREIVLSSEIVYGKGKTRPCAEFRFGSPVKTDAQPKMLNLLLRLPHLDRGRICRMFVSTRDWKTVNFLYYCPDGRYAQGANAYWQQPDLLLEAIQERGGEMQAYAIQYYSRLLENPDRANSIALWVEIALEHWAKRI